MNPMLTNYKQMSSTTVLTAPDIEPMNEINGIQLEGTGDSYDMKGRFIPIKQIPGVPVGIPKISLDSSKSTRVREKTFKSITKESVEESISETDYENTEISCWCCRSSLTVKNKPAYPYEAGVDELDGDEMPSKQEIQLWSESFDELMRSSKGRQLFRDFLKSEYSEENMMFWLACEDLKQQDSPQLVEEKARLIYDDYISILSPNEVSLDSKVREIINQNMVNPNKHTFEESQLQIYTLMHRDSYPRFLGSQLFKKLKQRYEPTPHSPDLESEKNEIKSRPEPSKKNAATSVSLKQN